MAQPAKNVELLSRVTFNEPASDVWGYAAAGREYALIGIASGTVIIDVTEPAKPRQVTKIAGPYSRWRDIKTYRHYAYVVEDEAPSPQALQIIDLARLPNAATLAASYGEAFRNAHNLFIDTTLARAYVVGGSAGNGRGGISILSLTDPLRPALIGSFSSNYVHDIYVHGTLAYGAAIFAGTVQIFDVANPAQIRLLRAFNTAPYRAPHNTWTDASGTVLATTDETRGGRLLLWDVADYNDIDRLGEYTANPQGSVHNVIVKGDSAYLAYYAEGFRVVDISDPRRPREVAYYDTHSGSGIYDGAWGVYPLLPSGTMLVSDIQGGLFVLRLLAPAPPQRLGDVDGDGICTSTDALLIMTYDAKLPVPPEVLARLQAGIGDVNGDGATNSTDALLLLSADAGLPVPFPVCEEVVGR